MSPGTLPSWPLRDGGMRHARARGEAANPPYLLPAFNTVLEGGADASYLLLPVQGR